MLIPVGRENDHQVLKQVLVYFITIIAYDSFIIPIDNYLIQMILYVHNIVDYTYARWRRLGSFPSSRSYGCAICPASESF